MDRYKVASTPDRRAFGILDRELYGYCTLMDENKNLLPLEWASRIRAEAWMNQCYRTWAAWEGNGEGVAPRGWRPRPPELSPWDPSNL